MRNFFLDCIAHSSVMRFTKVHLLVKITHGSPVSYRNVNYFFVISISIVLILQIIWQVIGLLNLKNFPRNLAYRVLIGTLLSVGVIFGSYMFYMGIKISNSLRLAGRFSCKEKTKLLFLGIGWTFCWILASICVFFPEYFCYILYAEHVLMSIYWTHLVNIKI